MDGETPSWLESESPSPASTPAPVPEPTSEPETFDLNEPAPSSEKTARAPTTDNIAGTILNNANTTADAPTKEVDESDLPKMIFVMRLMNLAAAGLLIAVSVSKCFVTIQNAIIFYFNALTVASDCSTSGTTTHFCLDHVTLRYLWGNLGLLP